MKIGTIDTKQSDARAAAAHAEGREFVRRMAAEGRGWEALQANLLPLGIDLSRGGRPVIYAIQGERIKKTPVNVSP